MQLARAGTAKNVNKVINILATTQAQTGSKVALSRRVAYPTPRDTGNYAPKMHPEYRLLMSLTRYLITYKTL